MALLPIAATFLLMRICVPLIRGASTAEEQGTLAVRQTGLAAASHWMGGCLISRWEILVSYLAPHDLLNIAVCRSKSTNPPGEGVLWLPIPNGMDWKE